MIPFGEGGWYKVADVDAEVERLREMLRNSVGCERQPCMEFCEDCRYRDLSLCTVDGSDIED